MTSNPGPSRRGRKSDAQLLREHGINQECYVVLSSDFVLNHGDNLVPKKDFRVHYGRNFLWEIANKYYRHPKSSVDLDRLYKTYITSPHSSLDRTNFKSIMTSYFELWDTDFQQRRMKLIRAKLKELNAKRKAEREAELLCKVSYHGRSAIVRKADVEQTKAALKRQAYVQLERIPLDELVPSTSSVVVEPTSTTDVESSSVDSSQDAISDNQQPCSLEDLSERRTAISGLVTNLITQVSDVLDEPDMSSTDCYSDDTVESPMEVEFGSGESPDFSKVIRDSEETCHGDEFYEVSRAKQQQGLSNGSTDKGSCVIQTITRSHDNKPIVVMKL